MKKTIKKALATALAIILAFSTVSIATAAETEADSVVTEYECADCSLSYVLYDDGTLYINGDGSITGHQLSLSVKDTVKKVIISDTVLGLNDTFLAGLEYLEEISVSDSHPSFCTADGVLFSKDKSILYAYPAGKNEAEYSIPEEVLQISPSAFALSKLKTLTVPENVTFIGHQAFSGSSLDKITVETKNNSLFIAAHAFEYCENLRTVNMSADQLYCVSSSSFYGTPFFEDEEKWENGVFYHNDILLAVNSAEVPAEYTIKYGTRLIADSATFYYSHEDENQDGYVKVTVPESVNNIGYESICLCDEIPSDLIRLGTCTAVLNDIMNSEDILTEQLKDLYEWYEKYNGEMTAESISALPNDLYYLVLTYKDYIQYAEPLLNSELYIFDKGIKGIADESQWKSIGYLAGYTFFYPLTTDGFIFADDTQMLSAYTNFNHEATELWIAQQRSEDFSSTVDENLDTEKSLTFLNSDMKIFDSPVTIWEGYTICGYPGSTAQEYAEKYGRKFVDISACSHEETATTVTLQATCKAKGYSGDKYCQYCGELLEKGVATDFADHSYGEWQTVDYAGCTRDGLKKRVCTVCEAEETEVIPASGHDFSDAVVYLEASCINYSVTHMYCTRCIWNYEVVYGDTLLPHVDEIRDGFCDNCGRATQEQENCSCKCHDDGFFGFFYDLLLLFQKLFGINKQCSCGVAHY